MRALFYTIFLLVITGCSYSSVQQEALDEAQRLMDDDPAAALSKLDDIDISEIRDSATMARWALLYSEAMVINRLSAPADTIVNIAIDYYGRHRQQNEYQKASRLKSLITSGKADNLLATYRYIQKEKEFLLYKERARRELYMFIGLAILLVAAGIIIWLRQRMKIQPLQNEALMAEASGFRQQADAIRGDVSRLETKLHGLLENCFSLIDSLCQTYYESQGTKTERKAIIDKVKSEIESVRTDSFPEMERAVNDCRDNLLVRVKEAYADIRPEDYRLLVYLASGLSTRTLSLLIGESVEVVYKRKSRLKSRLRESVEPVCPEIMAVF